MLQVKVLVCLLVIAACGAQVPKASEPCSAIEGVRRQIYDFERHEIDYLDWTKHHPAAQKHEAASAVVSELVATCTASHWSESAVACLVTDARKLPSSTDQPSSCKGTPSDTLVTRAFSDAEDRAFTKVFGPRPHDELEDFAEKWERWEQRMTSGVEPRVGLPSRYVGFAWFSREASPFTNYLLATPGGQPACVGSLLGSIHGYYQTQSLGGEKSLIAVLAMLDRDATETCLQEVAARLVPGARLERDGDDGALTRFITSHTVGYLGWAKDGTVYFHPDRAVVAEAVAQKTTITSNADVMALVARVDRKKLTWFVVAADATSKLIGVPSTGVLFASDILATLNKPDPKYTADNRPRIPVTLRFATPADAQRAVAALHAPHPALSPALGAQLDKLAPSVIGNELEIDIAPLFLMRSELLAELQAALDRVVGGRGN